MTTIEQARAKIRANSPKPGGTPRNLTLTWERESIHSLISNGHRYRINRDGPDDERTYSLDLTATSTAPGQRLGENFKTPDDAKAAAQAHFNQGVLPL